MQGMGISDLPKEKRFRLLIVFSAGNLLVNKRGRVWGGETEKD